MRERIGARTPTLAIILGTGLGGLVRHIEDPVDIPYAAIPGIPSPTVAGHHGRVTAGRLAQVEVLAWAGRFHVYEGHTGATAALPVRISHALGADTLLVSNAAGGIRRTFVPGDLMIIRDHINLMWRNPLTGPLRAGDTRFPDMSSPWDDELIALLRLAACDAGIVVLEGVYAAVAGPSYETPAEIRMLETLGADAVGMSTVPEVIAARAMGMRVSGVSCITNLAAGMHPTALDHAHVLGVAERAQASFERLLLGWAARL